MKTCTKCGIEKSKKEFGARKDARDGLKSNCRVCCNAGTKKWETENKEKVAARQAAWYIKNTEKVKQNSANFYTDNREKRLEQAKEWHKNNPKKAIEKHKKWRAKSKEYKKHYDRKYGQENPDKIAAKTAKRRAAKLKATPPWITEDQLKQIQEFYTEAKRLEALDGIPREVDHIVPLQGKTVSGLHIPWNLQILTATENGSKNNKLILID